MTEDDIQQLALFLSENWPNKFTADDGAYWANTFSEFAFCDIRDALTEHKNETRTTPRTFEIKRKLYAKSNPMHADNTAAATNFAAIIKHGNPGWRTKSDAEAVMRYHRYWFCRYIKACETRISNMESMLPPGERRDLSVASEQGRMCDCIDSSKRTCAIDLAGCGMDTAESERAAEFVIGEQHDFDLAVADMDQNIQHAASADGSDDILDLI